MVSGCGVMMVGRVGPLARHGLLMRFGFHFPTVCSIPGLVTSNPGAAKVVEGDLVLDRTAAAAARASSRNTRQRRQQQQSGSSNV